MIGGNTCGNLTCHLLQMSKLLSAKPAKHYLHSSTAAIHAEITFNDCRCQDSECSQSLATAGSCANSLVFLGAKAWMVPRALTVTASRFIVITSFSTQLTTMRIEDWDGFQTAVHGMFLSKPQEVCQDELTHALCVFMQWLSLASMPS